MVGFKIVSEELRRVLLGFEAMSVFNDLVEDGGDGLFLIELIVWRELELGNRRGARVCPALPFHLIKFKAAACCSSRRTSGA